MQPAATIVIILVAVTIASFLTVTGIMFIALGSSGVFSSKKSHFIKITTISTSTFTATPTTSTSTLTSNVTEVLNTTALATNTTTAVSNTTILTTTGSSTTTILTTTTAPGSPIITTLNDVSIYPNGSYAAGLSSFSSASDTLALLPVDATTLSQIGTIDNSSNIIEAGRAQYLYFHLPSTTSETSSRLITNSAVKRDADSSTSTGLLAGSSVVTGIAIHFVDQGSNDTVIIIPISVNSSTSASPLSGIFFYTLADGSILIRIEISVPTALCPFSNGQPIDACLSINYLAYTIVNNNQITSPLSVNIQMACGDVCSLPAGLCSASCTTCNGEQVEGFDTPITRRYDMGSSVGSFQFYYETYVIQDRITVWNAGQLLFDTGCVGATNTTLISYSSNSSSIRVDVEPNCNCGIPGGCGTAWIFTVYCSNSTNSSSRSILNKNTITGAKTIELSISQKADTEKYLYNNRIKSSKR